MARSSTKPVPTATGEMNPGSAIPAELDQLANLDFLDYVLRTAGRVVVENGADADTLSAAIAANILDAEDPLISQGISINTETVATHPFTAHGFRILPSKKKDGKGIFMVVDAETPMGNRFILTSSSLNLMALMVALIRKDKLPARLVITVSTTGSDYLVYRGERPKTWPTEPGHLDKLIAEGLDYVDAPEADEQPF